MNVVRGSLILGAITCLVVTEAAAQTIRSPYRFIDESQSVGVFGGYVVTARGSVGLGPENAAAAGLRYSIRLSGPFNVEAEAAYFPSHRPVRDTVVVGGERVQVGEADQALLLATAALRFNLTGPRTWKGLQPYVAFGVGGALDLSGSDPADQQLPADVRFDFGTSFAGMFGGGIEWFARNRLSIRFDARNYLWKVTTPFPFQVGELGPRTPEDEWIQNGFFTVGLAVRF